MKPNEYILAYAMFVAAIMAAARSARPSKSPARPGAPNATTTVDGRFLPNPPPPFGGVSAWTPRTPSRVGRRASCRPRARPTFSSS